MTTVVLKKSLRKCISMLLREYLTLIPFEVDVRTRFFKHTWGLQVGWGSKLPLKATRFRALIKQKS